MVAFSSKFSTTNACNHFSFIVRSPSKGRVNPRPFRFIRVIQTQTRAPTSYSSELFVAPSEALTSNLIGAYPSGNNVPIGDVPVSVPICTLMLNHFGFDIPAGVDIIAASVSRLDIINGTTSVSFEFFNTIDGTNIHGESVLVATHVSAGVEDYGDFDFNADLPSISEINGDGYGCIITCQAPPSDASAPAIDYIQITITYEDHVVSPVVLSGEAFSDKNSLSWTASPEASTYTLERSVGDTLSYETIYEGPLLAFDDEDITPSTIHYYRCTAHSEADDSNLSNVVSLSPDSQPDSPAISVWRPAGTYPVSRPTPSAIYAEFVPVDGATSYQVYIETEDYKTKERLGWSLAYSGSLSKIRIGGLLSHGPWYGKVRAKVGDVWSPFSEEAQTTLLYVYSPTLIKILHDGETG